ncbi:MAG: YARHG domain-containing protein [Devosia sp.]
MTKHSLGRAACRAAAGIAAVLFMSGTAMAESYRTMSCSELWYERNAIYADNGYCFKTAKARRVFGSACFPPYGKLSRSEQKEVDAIRRWERRKDCL